MSKEILMLLIQEVLNKVEEEIENLGELIEGAVERGKEGYGAGLFQSREFLLGIKKMIEKSIKPEDLIPRKSREPSKPIERELKWLTDYTLTLKKFKASIKPKPQK